MKLKKMVKKFGSFVITIFSMIIIPILVMVLIFYFLFALAG